MKRLLISTVLLAVAACQPAMATMPNAPQGAEATGCDLDEYAPVFGKDGNILYWLNPTCPMLEDSNDNEPLAPVVTPPEEPKKPEDPVDPVDPPKDEEPVDPCACTEGWNGDSENIG